MEHIKNKTCQSGNGALRSRPENFESGHGEGWDAGVLRRDRDMRDHWSCRHWLGGIRDGNRVLRRHGNWISVDEVKQLEDDFAEFMVREPTLADLQAAPKVKSVAFAGTERGLL